VLSTLFTIAGAAAESISDLSQSGRDIFPAIGPKGEWQLNY
jgi:hypothetical protein